MINVLYMRFKNLSLLAILLFSLVFYGFNPDPIKRIVESLEKWTAHYPVEKVHLHLDKPYYAIGDTIWFKAYVTVSNKHLLSAVSGVLNVELINENDSLVKAIKLPVSAGLTWGDFTLADSLKDGNYRIRAYTNWMRNAGDEYFFDREIQVLDYRHNSKQAKEKQLSEGNLSVTADVQFFPESGNLITGIASKVAFKATDINGRGIAIKGIISDTDNHKVAEINTEHAGMGSFSMLPERGKQYQAEVQYPDGSKKLVKLPVAEDKGFILAITEDHSGELTIQIKTNPAWFAEVQNSEVSLVAQSGGAVLYVANSKLVSPVLLAKIPKTRFPSGIVQFTLFSGEGLPLNERLMFIRNNDQLTLNLISAKTIVKANEQVKMNIEALKPDKGPAEGSFSVSVINEDKVPFDDLNESTIFSNLLLSSDIKGYIENPGYYFNDMTERTRSDLDLLMLTQAYRRFEWKQLLSDTLPAPVYRAEKGIEITGKVRSVFGQPVKKGNVSLIAPNSSLFVQARTDDQGKFSFQNLFFPDTSKFMLQVQTEKGNKNVVIQVDDNHAPIIRKRTTGSRMDSIINTRVAAYLKNSGGQNPGLQTTSIQLKEVKVTGKKTVQHHSSNIGGIGNADVVINSKEIGRGGGTLPDILQRSYGLVVDAEGIYNTRGPKLYSKMRIIVDGVYMDANALGNINPSEVSSIEILKTAGSLGIYGVTGDHGGIVIVNTKRGDEYDVPLKKDAAGVISLSVKGFYPTREFYTPKSNPATSLALKRDHRTTIYWKPDLLTDSTGKASFDFFSGRAPGNYIVIIEGIDIQGNLGRQVYRYHVKDEGQ